MCNSTCEQRGANCNEIARNNTDYGKCYNEKPSDHAFPVDLIHLRLQRSHGETRCCGACSIKCPQQCKHAAKANPFMSCTLLAHSDLLQILFWKALPVLYLSTYPVRYHRRASQSRFSTNFHMCQGASRCSPHG